MSVCCQTRFLFSVSANLQFVFALFFLVVHAPSIFCHAGCRFREVSCVPPHSDVFSFLLGDPEAFQSRKRHMISPVCSGCTLGSSVRDKKKLLCPGGILLRCLKYWGSASLLLLYFPWISPYTLRWNGNKAAPSVHQCWTNHNHYSTTDIDSQWAAVCLDCSYVINKFWTLHYNSFGYYSEQRLEHTHLVKPCTVAQLHLHHISTIVIIVCCHCSIPLYSQH